MAAVQADRPGTCEPWCPPASCSHSQKELGVHFVLFWGYRDNSFQKPPAHLPDMLVPRHYPATHWPLSWGAQSAASGVPAPVLSRPQEAGPGAVLSAAMPHRDPAAHSPGQRGEDRALLLVLHQVSPEPLWGPRPAEPWTYPQQELRGTGVSTEIVGLSGRPTHTHTPAETNFKLTLGRAAPRRNHVAPDF